jgi:hypothetical protein
MNTVGLSTYPASFVAVDSIGDISFNPDCVDPWTAIPVYGIESSKFWAILATRSLIALECKPLEIALSLNPAVPSIIEPEALAIGLKPSFLIELV